MTKTSFKEIKPGKFFVWMDWVHRKINDTTSIAVGYAASNGMDPDTIVLAFEEDEIAAIKEEG